MADDDDKLNVVLEWVIKIAGIVMGLAWLIGWMARLLCPDSFDSFRDEYLP